ncbi:MAG: triose-phosphate isomerase [Candidatus Diapherotrites archaeon]
MRPVLFLNFKTYAEATGAKAVALAKAAEKVSKASKCKIVLVPQAVDIGTVASSSSLEIFSQHIDPVTYGSHTGSVLPEAVKSAGASGTITNHAEDRQGTEFISACVKRAREAHLKIMLCAETPKRAAELARLGPDFIAIEPPELIGGKLSVSTAKPEVISAAVAAVHAVARIPVIAGAGINSAEDVKKSLELGASGVFVSSAVVKAKNPAEKLKELLCGFG